MPDYRIYGLNEDGGFISVHEVRTDTDDEALAVGRELVGSDAFEVWEHARMVAQPACADRPAPGPARRTIRAPHSVAAT